jgi:hypothetical protein
MDRKEEVLVESEVFRMLRGMVTVNVVGNNKEVKAALEVELLDVEVELLDVPSKFLKLSLLAMLFAESDKGAWMQFHETMDTKNKGKINFINSQGLLG